MSHLSIDVIVSLFGFPLETVIFCKPKVSSAKTEGLRDVKGSSCFLSEIPERQ